MLTFVHISRIPVRMVNKSTPRTDFIASLAKGLRVVECFGADTPRLTITDVATHRSAAPARNGDKDSEQANQCVMTTRARTRRLSRSMALPNVVSDSGYPQSWRVGRVTQPVFRITRRVFSETD